ncbi:MAG: tetratricopeptide repeat protein [Chloroflexia bacterium]|nr:tetratricopeptide repeat protein [Chloroflexia bacterium]
MAQLLPILAPYLPYRLLQQILRRPETPSGPTAERFAAAVLFADVSGFTALTEALAQQGAEGPEELTRLLNRYFSRMIALIEAEGGEVVEFGGDAVIVLFPAEKESASTPDRRLGQAVRRARQAAEAMQAAMVGFTLQTSAGVLSLEMKVSIGAGDLLGMRVGGVFERWEYLVAGDPLRQVSLMDRQAHGGDILLSPEAAALMAARALEPRPLRWPDWDAVDDPAVVAAVRCQIPGAIRSWLEGGLHEWLAVLRPMTVLFANLAGLNNDRDDVVPQLHTLLRRVQETVYRYEGSLARLAVDDKGTVLMVLFGAPPMAHEDNPVRAVQCALDLLEMASLPTDEETPALLPRITIGLATGHVFAGPVGGETRREYTVMGDTVNLAARLMGAGRRAEGAEDSAESGGILCDFETYRQSRERIVFENLPPIRLKGKSGLLRVYRPNPAGTSVQPLAGRAQTPLVGRERELAHLEQALAAVEAGQGQVWIIEGEAGIGKSRLVLELARLMQERGLTGLLGAGRSAEQRTPYRAWRDVLTSYFDLEELTSTEERQRRVQQLVGELAPEQLPRLPLLNDVLSLGLPDTALSASLDPALRQQNLLLLLLSLLRAWARERPLILVLEDAQWLDSLSWDLAVYTARALTITEHPVLLVLATRPLDPASLGGQQLETLGQLAEPQVLTLQTLPQEQTVALAAGRLGLQPRDLPAAVADLVRERAGGNPFFAEELAYTLRDQGLLQIEDDPREAGRRRCRLAGDMERAAQTLPDTVQGLVLARIDRLPPQRQLTLKVGAVIGRSFGYSAIHYTIQRHTAITETALDGHLQALSALDLVPLESPVPEPIYMFKHIITQEVAYGTLLFAQRRQLHHTVAEWYEGAPERSGEKKEAALSPHLPLLVYHYHQAGNVEKERRYARLAGEQAARQFANAEAVRFFRRALELTPAEEFVARYELLLAREKVYDLQGDREAQLQDLRALQVQVLENDMGLEPWAKVTRRWAEYALATGDYDLLLAKAKALRERAEQTAASASPASPSRQQGLLWQAQGHLLHGKVCWKQGAYDQAREQLGRALRLAQTAAEEGAGDQERLRRLEAGIFSNLGVVSLESGRYEDAENYLNQALSTFQALGDRRAVASTYNNLANMMMDRGNYERAIAHQQRALQLHQEMGDRYGEGVILHNMGLALLNQGDYAGTWDYYEQGLQLCREIGDRQGESYLLGGLGMVSSYLGQYEAGRRYLLESLDLCRDMGDRRSECMSLDLLSFAAHHAGDHELALAYSQQAREISQDPDYRMIHGYVLFNLGNALAGLGQLQPAAAAFQTSYEIRQDVGQSHLAIESLAGLARVQLARGNSAEALAQVEQILDYLQAHSLEGTMEPLRVYWNCYQVLHETGDPRTTTTLSTAQRMLQDRAARISDEEMRQSFLWNVPAHRRIGEAPAGP